MRSDIFKDDLYIIPIIQNILPEFNELKNKPLKIIKPTYKSHSKYPYFSDLVILDLKKIKGLRD